MMDIVGIPQARMSRLKRDRKLVKKLEELAGVKITLEDSVEIDCDDPVKAMSVKSVIKAFGRGFGMEDALYLLDESYELCIIDVKDFAKSAKRGDELKGRVIGSAGKTKNIIEKLANVKVSIYGKTISIIGKWDNVQLASQAVCMLLEGRKHTGVYKFLDENIKRVKY